MTQQTFQKILNIWKKSEQTSIAKMPIFKTDSCLSFAQFEAAEFSIEQKTHIHQCNYCAQMNTLFRKYRSLQNEVSISGEKKETRLEQAMIWDKLKKKFNDLVKGLSNIFEPIPAPIKVAIPIMITTVILIFALKTPEAKYAALAQIEPLYYQPIEVRGEESLSEIEKLFQQGIAFYQQADYDSAINKLLLVIKSQPEDINANFYVGLCYLLLKKPDQAIVHLQKVIELKGEFLFEKCYWYLGNAYLLKNDRKKALEIFEKVVAMEGDFEWEAREMIVDINEISDR